MARRRTQEEKRAIVHRHIIGGEIQSVLDREIGNKSVGQVSAWVRAYRAGKLGEPFKDDPNATRSKPSKRGKSKSDSSPRVVARRRRAEPETQSTETQSAETQAATVEAQPKPAQPPPQVEEPSPNGDGHATVETLDRDRQYINEQLSQLSDGARRDLARELAGAHLAAHMARLEDENVHMRALLKLHL